MGSADNKYRRGYGKGYYRDRRTGEERRSRQQPLDAEKQKKSLGRLLEETQKAMSSAGLLRRVAKLELFPSLC